MPDHDNKAAKYYYASWFLARIIHQSQKLTEEGALGSRMILNSRLTRASSSSNKRIRLSWHCTNRSHGHHRAQCVLTAPAGLPQALRPDSSTLSTALPRAC